MENTDNARTYAELLAEALKYHAVGSELYQFDPLWNRLQLSVTQDDCPRSGCQMTLPHLHSIIDDGVRERGRVKLQPGDIDRLLS